MPFLKKATMLFDLVHNEMLNLDEPDYSGFLSLLQREGIKIKKNEDKDLSNKLLNAVDIVVLGNPINDYLSNIEIKHLVNYVRGGGGLLLISEYGADYLQKTNLNDLAEKYFGIYFEKNIVKEENKENENCSSVVSIHSFDDHKMTNQLREVVIGGTCTLILNKRSKAILKTNNLSWTESFLDQNSKTKIVEENKGQTQIIAACTEYGKGKVCALGDIDIFTNNENFGLQKFDNNRLVLNVLSWLIEPIKESEVMTWILNQVGAMQYEMKELTNKIDNLIETISLVENRVSYLEEIEHSEGKESLLKKPVEKKPLEEEKSSFV